MKTHTLVCLLLSLCVSSLVAGPPPQGKRQNSGESKCGAGFKQCQESLKDFKEGKEFMQLKATLVGDLNQLEESRPTQPKTPTVRDADRNRRKTGNSAVYSATVGPNGKSSVPATRAVQPASLDSTAGTPGYIRMP